MIRVLFVCLGNICRSPMAEFVMKDMVKRSGLDKYFYIASAGTSNEEEGNIVHTGTTNKLREYGISTKGKTAIQLCESDYGDYDYILAMEQSNLRGIMRIIKKDPKGKVSRLLDFSQKPRDIADPWYTGNFNKTYEDIKEGCEDFLSHLINEGEIYG